MMIIVCNQVISLPVLLVYITLVGLHFSN
jgi:hypothetical protein